MSPSGFGAFAPPPIARIRLTYLPFMPEPLENWFNPERFRSLGDLLAECHRASTAVNCTPRHRVSTSRSSGGCGAFALRATLPSPTGRRSRCCTDRAAHRPCVCRHDAAGFRRAVGLTTSTSRWPRYHFTRFSSGEFAIREFCATISARALAVMERWSRDDHEHVARQRRLPPASAVVVSAFALIADPHPSHRSRKSPRPSLYVSKSVANHLNDISRITPPGCSHASVRDLAHRALLDCQTPSALLKPATRELARCSISPAVRVTRHLSLHQSGSNSVSGTVLVYGSLAGRRPQRLAIDYVIHYEGPRRHRAQGFQTAARARSSATVALRKSQVIRDFTTRRHHRPPPREIQINGRICGGELRSLRAG